MIYAKLDWYCCMLLDIDMQSILDRLTVPYDLHQDFLSSVFRRSNGFNDVLVYSFNGVSFETPMTIDNILVENENPLLSSYKVVRVDISGSGLDFLRSIGFNPEQSFMQPDFWGSKHLKNVTRADFAFDFVNFKPGFVQKLNNWITDFERSKDPNDLTHRTVNGGFRLPTGKPNGISYSNRTGDQSTVYLGTLRASKLLRIYDKLRQQCPNGVWKEKVDFLTGTSTTVRPLEFADEGDIYSWFRIELQARRDTAESCLWNSHGDLKNVLRYIFDNFMLYDSFGRLANEYDPHRPEPKPLDFFVDLYNWEELPQIIQNAKFVEQKTVHNANIDFVLRNRVRLKLVLSDLGAHGLISLINEAYKRDQMSFDISAIYRLKSEAILYQRLLSEQGCKLSDLNVVLRSDRIYLCAP